MTGLPRLDTIETGPVSRSKVAITRRERFTETYGLLASGRHGGHRLRDLRPFMRVAVNVEQCWHAVPGGTGRVTVDLLRAVYEGRGSGPAAVDLVGVAARHAEMAPEAFRPRIPVTHSRLPQKTLYEAWHGARRPRAESLVGPVDVTVGLGGATPPTAGPLVVTVHDLAFLHFPEFYTRHGLRFLRRGLELIRREATLVPVVSQATFDDCVAHGFDPERLRVIPWGIDIPDVDPDDVVAARRRFDIQGRYVVVVGTLEPRKNLRRLMDAWNRLHRDDVTLVVIGPRGWGDAIGARPANVVFTGFVERKVRDALYTGAELSVYPSLFEGFGLPVLESMALGCPVVTSLGTSTEELVADGGGVAVEPTDANAIADAIANILDDDDERKRLSESGRRVARAYTWDACARANVAVWAEAAEIGPLR